ncbi:MAG: sugar phosphate nucleotidyltransferase, partial [Thermodesulfobacteriota bacterium]
MDIEKIKSLSVPVDISLKDAIKNLNNTAEQILFVVDKRRRLKGTVTDGDIRRALINGRKFTTTMKEIMREDFVSIFSDKPGYKEKARALMDRHMVAHIPVLDRKGVIVNVCSLVDCLGGEETRTGAEKIRLHNPVVIMAGGMGSRLDPFTRILPKPLIPVGDKPVVEHIMNRFHRNGFHRFVLVVNYKKEIIKMYFSEADLPYEVQCMEEEDYYGTAGGLTLLKERIKESFIVTNCDTILENSYDFLAWHKERKNLLTIVGSPKEFVIPYGVLSLNNGTFQGIDEKPSVDLFINTGSYVFEPDVFDFIKDREHMDMDNLI